MGRSVTVDLTTAEQEVVDCIARGWDYPTIAGWLGIKESTVRVYVVHIARKLPRQGKLRGYAHILYWLSTRQPPTNVAA